MRGGQLLRLAVVLGGCGRLAFDPLADRAGDGLAAKDGAPLGAFGPAQLVSLGPSSDDADPTLTSDLLELYFASQRPGGSGGVDLWVATRTSITEPWGAPVAVTALNSSADDETPEVSRDGLTIFFASRRSGGAGNLDLYVATRPARGVSWSTPQAVTELNTGEFDSSPTVDSSRTLLYFHRSTSGGTELFATARANPTAPWSAPTAITELNSPADEWNPALSPAALAVMFASDRPGGFGSFDLYLARRPAAGAAWSAPTPVLEVNSSAREGDPWLSDDERVLVFSSDRAGTTGIYVAVR